MAYSYTAYGLRICAPIELPELIPASPSGTADVTIHMGPVHDSPFHDVDCLHTFRMTPHGMFLYWQGVGTFQISQGTQVTIEVAPDLDEDRLRLFILGAVMAVLLHQRGYFVLHASAVAIGGRAVVFTADKRHGKSTMAATLHARGHQLLADDVVALDLRAQDSISVLPAFPQIKLWPDAVEHLGTSPEQMTRLGIGLKKRAHRLEQGFSQHHVPLSQIYVLGQGDSLAILPLKPQEILHYLTRNSYVTRFDSELLQPNDASHFLRLTELARRVSISRLQRPVSLDLLPDVAQLVEEQNHKYVEL